MVETIRKRIAFVVSAEGTAKVFLIGHLRALAVHYDVALIADTSNPDYLRSLGVEGQTHPVALKRKINPIDDLKALISLTALFRRERFDAVHSVTPKAGLLGMMAARFSGVRLRTHTFTGQVWATKTGLPRFAFKQFDKLIASLTTFSLVDSGTQRDFLLKNDVLPAARSGVLADGSICGVDSVRFRPDATARGSVRAELGLADDDLVFLFLGRITRDKGVTDLVQAFARLARQWPKARLVIVGPDEDDLQPELIQHLGLAMVNARFVPLTNVPERYVAACDVFCLPSYREGFGSSVIEAAAAGVPALASRIYGIMDAVEEGETGLLHPPRDISEIHRLMVELAADETLRLRLGEAARARALTRFSAQRVIDAMQAYYQARL